MNDSTLSVFFAAAFCFFAVSGEFSVTVKVDPLNWSGSGRSRRRPASWRKSVSGIPNGKTWWPYCCIFEFYYSFSDILEQLHTFYGHDFFESLLEQGFLSGRRQALDSNGTAQQICFATNSWLITLMASTNARVSQSDSDTSIPKYVVICLQCSLCCILRKCLK